MTNKKAQITIFMMVGLLLILGGIIFFYSTKKISKPFEPEIKIVEEQIPREFDPIKNYVNDCVYSLAVDGLKIIGKQGGYISFTNKSLSTEPFTITQNPTESDAVYFTKDSDLKVAYWWYLKSSNKCKEDCKFASKRPDLRQTDNSIEKQLERYINSKFKECLNDFSPFVDQGFKIIESAKVESDVTIALEDIAVSVKYPLSVERDGTKAILTQFLVNVPVNLDKIYDLATKITNLEMKHMYLEKHVLNLLVAFSGVDKKKLPPMSDMQFKFGSSMSWQKSDIKKQITELLLSYIPLFQVDGTYNYERNNFDSELKQRLYDSTIIPVANSSFRDLSAYFTYLDFWPAYFDLNCNGERCIPSSANSLISIFGIQTYRFAYDLSFPVFVEIKDPFALDGEGYTFNLFLEGNLRNNKPMPGNFTPLERIVLSDRSLVCDTRTSGNITVNVMKPANKNVLQTATKKSIQDAQVLYTITDESCFIGSTNPDGILKEIFPVGVGGFVSIVKDGYIGKSVEFEPRAGKNSNLNVELKPIYTKKLIVKKKNIVKTPKGWEFSNTPLDLNEKESASVTLTRINDEGELDFSSIANYEGKQKEPNEIEIAPGKYSADINLMLNERIVIPEKEKCFKKGIFGGKECFTIPKVDFGEKYPAGDEMFSEGGLKLNLTLNANDIENNDEIVFYAVSIDIAGIPEQYRVIEDIDQMEKTQDYSDTYQIALQPTYRKKV